ncbi:MAG TPA: NUDIX domain-containing protein [Flavisolibacter sp.]|nr:NUDIX domain-containing protein [Flavisolibacter sp.]
MLITIHFDRKPLFLTDSINKEIEPYLGGKDVVQTDMLSGQSVRETIRRMGEPETIAGIFLHGDPQTILEAIKKEFFLIQAAGGLVHTGAGEVLLIHRRGKWDLPKGKLDEGEDLVTCALREIEEETGLNSLSAERPLITTYHTYHQDGRHILKESHWFLVRSPRQQVLMPQLEEDIDQCKWVKTALLGPYMDDSHASIVDVIKAGLPLLPGSLPA